MDNFLKIASGVDVVPLLVALKKKNSPQWWGANPIRTEHDQSPHKEVDDILLRFSDLEALDSKAKVINDKNNVCHTAWYLLPQARQIILDLMYRVGALELGRCVITKLAPGGRIYPHVDEGAPAEYYTRFQIAIQSNPGCIFRIEEEEVCFKSGDVWMIDNRKEHEVKNNSNDDRIVLIADMRLD